MRTKSRILIVEDNELVARVLKAQCIERGFRVSHAVGVESATKYLLRYCFGLIFMDLGLADGDGKSLTEWIRQEENLNQRTSIVVVSAHMDEELKRSCLAAGANEVLVKPLLASSLNPLLKGVR